MTSLSSSRRYFPSSCEEINVDMSATGDEIDVGVIRPKPHLLTDDKKPSEDAHRTTSLSPDNKSNENSAPVTNSVPVTASETKHNEQITENTAEIQQSSVIENKANKDSSKTNHSTGLESDGLRQRSTASRPSDQQNNSSGAQKEEKNGQLILEEFLDAECADGDDDDSAWEDVDEEEEDHPEGDDKHTCDIPYPGVYATRDPNPELPDTVTSLSTPCGSKVYLVGTAHFSESSQEDVAKTIAETQPDIVMVELCASRVNLLSVDEETLLQEAKNLNMDKVRSAIRQSGFVQGIMHVLLLSMSAHLTEQLGMAPGGEFRRALKEAQKINGCRIRLGDRPIHITLRRALGSLSVWQKTRLAWYLITSKEPISKEEVEKCKEKDLLEEMLREMTGEFPPLSEVFVSERDLFLTNSLRQAARPIPNPEAETGMQPAVVVGVVGIGHVPGIVENWEKPVDARELMRIPPASKMSVAMKWTFRALLVGALTWSCYKLYRIGSHVVVSTYNSLPSIRAK